MKRYLEIDSDGRCVYVNSYESAEKYRQGSLKGGRRSIVLELDLDVLLPPPPEGPVPGVRVVSR